MASTMSSGFSRLFNPRGIAVVGASEDAARPGAQTLRALQRHGYAGHVCPVNPRRTQIGGLRCHASIADIDEPCDVAVIALPAAQVPAAVAECARKAIGFAVVLGGGFRESGPAGVQLEADLVAAARAGGVRVIGPNCLGLVNVPNRAYASFSSLARAPDLQPGAVSAVIQSGGFGNSLVVQATLAGIGFQTVVASGNEADISTPELIHAFADDPHTQVILAYLEGLNDGRAFLAAARHALAAGKPLVVLKAGNTREGARAAASHTAYLTSAHDIYRAAFAQCGVIETQDIHDTVDMLRMLGAGRQAAGARVAVIGGSGGSAVNFSDAADGHGLVMATLDAATLAVLERNLPDNGTIGTIGNPIDYTASFINGPDDLRFLHSVRALFADPGVDQVAVLLALTAGERFAIVAGFLAQAASESGKPVAVFSSVPRESGAQAFDILSAANIPVFASPRRAAAAMGMLARQSHIRTQRGRLCHDGDAQIAPLGGALPPCAGTMDEHAAKQWLAASGIPVTRDALVPAGAASLPPGLRYPVAVKVVSPDIAHKTDIGGVKLGIADDAALAQAVAAVLANAASAAPQARIEGALVSEMIGDGIETLVGVLNDRLFGPVVALGMGGVLAEVLRDTSYRVAPFGLDTAFEMIASLRGAAVFDGVRGQPARDTQALAQVLVRVSQLAWQARERIAEIDLNPVLVRPAGLGAVAADALVVLGESG